MSGFASRNEFELIETSDCMCPGQSITYECTVVVAHGVFTIWTGSIMEAGCEIILINSQQASEFLHQQRVCNGGAVVGRGVEVHDNCYTSQVTVLLTSDLDHRTIQCSSADTGDSTITIGEAQILLTTGIIILVIVYAQCH